MFSLCGFQSVKAQFAGWVDRFGSSAWDLGFSVCTDSAGYIYAAGIFEGTVDFDPGPGTLNLSSGLVDAYFMKLDPSGNLIWARNFGGAEEDQIYSIAVDGLGNLFLGGFFKGTMDFDPGPSTTNLSSSGVGDAFVTKFDTAGNFIWTKKFGSLQSDVTESLIADDKGRIYLTGIFNNDADLDPGPASLITASSGFSDIFIARLDSAGNLDWVKTIGSSLPDISLSIALDSSGHVLTTGYFKSVADFDPGTGFYNMTSAGEGDIFVSCLDSMGDFLWAKQFGGTGNDYGYSIAVDSAGNVYAGGFFENSLDADPGPATLTFSSAGGFDAALFKLDPAGNLIWARQWGGALGDFAYSLKSDPPGNVYVTGYFFGSVDFDPGPAPLVLSSAGDLDIFALKYDSAGTLDWAIHAGSTLQDNGYAIAVDDNDEVIVSGGFSNTVDFDPGSGVLTQTASGTRDAFIWKITQCAVPSTNLNVFGCTSYTTPSGSFTWNTSGTYSESFTLSTGCDSTIIYQVSIGFTTDSITESACTSYLSPSGNYTWTASGTYLDTIPNFSGCDSLITIFLTIGNVASTQFVSACNEFVSSSGTTYYTSGLYSDTLLAASGCDSIVTLNLDLDFSLYSIINSSGCNSFVSPSGNHVWTTSGLYFDTLAAPAPCGHIYEINLSVYSEADSTVLVYPDSLVSAVSGGLYQWVDCNDGYSNISGQNQQSFIVPSQGSYALIINQGGCIDTSACYSFVFEGFSSAQSSNRNALVYPVPFQHSFWLNGKPGNVCRVEWTDLSGRHLRSEMGFFNNEGWLQLNGQELASGIYFIRVFLPQEVSVYKVLKD